MKFEATLKYKKNVERYIAIIRLVIILFCASIYFLFYNQVEANNALIISFAALSIAYGAYINAFLPFNNLSIKWAIGITYSVDLVLILTWIFLSGGLNSPFWVLLLISIVGLARRFGIKSTAIMTLVYIASFILVGYLETSSIQFYIFPDTYLKTGFIIITAALVSVYKLQEISRKESMDKDIILINKLNFLANQHKDEFIILDEDFKIEYLSSTFDTEFEELFKGKDILKFIHKEDVPSYLSALDKAKRTLMPQEVEIRSNTEFEPFQSKYISKITFYRGEKDSYLVCSSPLRKGNAPKFEALDPIQPDLKKPEKTSKGPISKIWVVEDNEINVLLLKRILQNLGYHNVEVHYDGKSAFDAIQAKSSEELANILLFIDIEMPVMNGEELIEEIQEHFPFLILRSVGVTAHTEEDIVDYFPKTKIIRNWLSKPFSEEKVKECIENYLE